MIVDCLSDLHGFYPNFHWAPADLLIIAGDCTRSDDVHQWEMFFDWLKIQKHTKKIVVGGNHDNFLMHRAMQGLSEFDYLYDSGIEFMGYKIWGSPWSKKFPGMNPKCMAFTVDHERDLAKKWKMIPDDTDILVTHTPAFERNDEVLKRNDVGDDWVSFRKESVGSTSLARWLKKHKDTLKLHVCGHVHEGSGYDSSPPPSCNASFVDRYYKPANLPWRIVMGKTGSRLSGPSDRSS